MLVLRLPDLHKSLILLSVSFLILFYYFFFQFLFSYFCINVTVAEEGRLHAYTSLSFTRRTILMQILCVVFLALY